MANTYFQTALRTLEIEAQAIVALKESLDEKIFSTCIDLIFHSNGRVVVTGIGKSAIVAQKIAATFNSTGTPSLFMHAADAIHGDLGMIGRNDVVLCLSKSGNTPEIQALVPLVKNMGNPLIAMTAEPKSFLALQADFMLYTPVSQEADPNNLAPTTSTTLQMALGDAMATALLAMRGFSSEDFSKLHPGGSLGKQLYLKVSDICFKNEKPIVSPTATLQEVIVEITSKRLGATAVLDHSGQILGIVTDGDLRRLLERNPTLTGIFAKDIMSKMPRAVSKEDLAVKALQIMREHKISQLLVLEQNNYAGIVHLHDLIREGII